MKNLLISLFAIMAIVSCSESDGVDDGGNTPTTSTITLSKSSVTFDECADEEKITFSATADWFAEIVNDSAGGWLSVSPTSGRAGDVSITIKATNNDSSNERSASISIKAGSAQKTINVTQKKKDILVSTEPATIYVEVSCEEDTLHNHIAKTFGSSVTSIKRSGNGYLITLRAGANMIPERAFQQADWVTHIIIGDGVMSIGKRAFLGCYYLTNITIPNSVTSIGELAFLRCWRLTDVTIPDNVTSIENSTFGECHSLARITIPDRVTSIGDSAFSGCRTLASITIPNSVTSIGDSAFSECYALTSVTIGKGVESIGSWAFAGCYALTSITIPGNVAAIGGGAFNNCNALKTFYGKYASADNRCLVVNGVLNSFAPAGLTSYDTPDNVTSIGEYAFYYCGALASITIPNSVTSIGSWAFEGCDALTSITIPDNVTSIGSCAFYNCDALANFYCKAITPPTLGRNVFGLSHIALQYKIYVPAAAADTYKSAAGWNSYADIIVGYYF